MNRFFLLLFARALAGCGGNIQETGETASPASVYYNGDFFTMEGDEPQYVEAIVVRDGRIAFAGATGEANGVLEELAAIPVFFPVMTPSSPELADYYLDKAQEMALRFGYTTA